MTEHGLPPSLLTVPPPFAQSELSLFFSTPITAAFLLVFMATSTSKKKKLEKGQNVGLPCRSF